MERKNDPRASVVGFLVVVLMLLNQVRAGKYYYCWGGCVNQCVLLTGKQPTERFPCYMNCVNKCFTPPSVVPRPSVVSRPPSGSLPSELPDQSSSNSHPQYYCWLGCSLETCMLVSRDGAELKTCLSSCSRMCKP